jgi:predicted kinase
MSKICLLIGTVACGKSTYAKQKAGDGWIIINDDSIVMAVHSGNYELYNPQLKPLYKGIELFILNTAIAMDKSVVVDKGISLTRESRQRWISIGRSLDIPVECVVFEFATPEVHAARRVNSDGRGLDYDYWLRVAKHHFDIYAEPTLEEGFSCISHLGGGKNAN